MKKAFTLIELLVVVSIIVLLSVIGLVLLTGKRSASDLSTTISEAAALLREAENRSMTETQGVSWGVHFANSTSTEPFYALFYTAYSPTTTAGYYPLPTDVSYTASTIPPGSSLNVTFAQVTGLASASTTIGLYIVNPQRNLLTTSSVISIASSGAVSY